MRRAAVFDATGAYRYVLSREWDDGEGGGGKLAPGRVCFVMLNPSAADHERDDPTIRRCLGFARRWGFGALDVVNLWAFRTHAPEVLRAAADPAGPDNDRHLTETVARASLVVAAWGVHGAWRGRGAAVRPLLGANAVCLGRTRGGEPRHPLYVRGDAEPEPFTSPPFPLSEAERGCLEHMVTPSPSGLTLANRHPLSASERGKGGEVNPCA